MTRSFITTFPIKLNLGSVIHYVRKECLSPLVLLLVLFQVLPLAAQSLPSTPLNPAIGKTKQQLSKISPDGKLTVTKIDGTEYHGRLQSTGSETFVVREVDLKQTLTISYAEVDHISKNYGGKGFGGHRVNPRRNLIAGIVTGAVLLALVIALVASDKS